MKNNESVGAVSREVRAIESVFEFDQTHKRQTAPFDARVIGIPMHVPKEKTSVPCSSLQFLGMKYFLSICQQNENSFTTCD